ncbi:MAG: hypothetical protein IPK97_17990 [Ahniella sp.]|nr:hypothetical protein [Ahniella sp.]
MTEIVSSVDFDETEYKQVYDPNSSAEAVDGSAAEGNCRGRIDLIMDVASGKVPMTPRQRRTSLQGVYHVVLDHAAGRCSCLAE